mmetsp:Transcript_19323/g.37317  ORF Transcript_19323/g.37317 Transcript_19323/m.37317 type:complete len:949 (-) Transcript_19323:160-3006(-)
MGRSTQVQEWSGLPVREVQLGDEVDVNNPDAVAKAAERVLIDKERLARGELKKVKKISPGTNIEASSGAKAAPISTGHMTNYDGWYRFDDEDDTDTKEDEYDLVEVSEEERQQEAIQKQARSNALSYKEKGNDLFKKGDYAGADKAYSSGLRHFPTATLFANRAQARLKLDQSVRAEADCTKALVLDAGMCKAYVRRSTARQNLKKFEEALADARAARKLEPGNKELKRIQRAVEAAQLEHEYDQVLITAADGGAAPDLPEGTAQELQDIKKSVGIVAAAATDPEQRKGVKTQLTKLKRLLKSSERNRDYFALIKGVQTVLDVYTEDNLLVLSVVVEACRKNEHNVNALCKSPGIVDFLVKTIRDRRVAVIAIALDLLQYLIPKMKTVCTRIRQGPYLETMVLMLAKAPPSLHERVVTCLQLMSTDARVRFDMRSHAGALAEGLARATASASSEVQREAVEMALNLAGGDDKLCSLLATETLAQTYIELVGNEAETTPEVRRVEFAGGAELVYRDLSRLRQERAHVLLTTLKAMHALCAEPKFVAFLDNMDAWLVLLPMLAAPADLMGASLQVFQRCVAVSNHPSSAVAELGGTEDLVNAALTCRAGANQDAAFAVMRACSDIPVFLNSLKGMGVVKQLADLIVDGVSDTGLANICWVVTAVAQFDTSILTELCNLKGFGKRLVKLWYSHTGRTQNTIEVLLNKVMETEDGSRTLAEGMEEAQILKFVGDLRAKRQMDVAVATGGANILNPAKYGPSGVPLSEDSLLVEDEQRDADLAKIDSEKLHRYLSTLLPRSDPNPAVVDLHSGTGRLALSLAGLFASSAATADTGVHFYGVEKEPQKVEYLSRRAAQQNIVRFTAVQSENAIDSVPVSADILLFVGLWMALEEPVETLKQSLKKLKSNGKLCLIEDDPNILLRAKKAALEGGCAIVAQPELLQDHYVCILTKV